MHAHRGGMSAWTTSQLTIWVVRTLSMGWLTSFFGSRLGLFLSAFSRLSAQWTSDTADFASHCSSRPSSEYSSHAAFCVKLRSQMQQSPFEGALREVLTHTHLCGTEPCAKLLEASLSNPWALATFLLVFTVAGGVGIIFLRSLRAAMREDRTAEERTAVRWIMPGRTPRAGGWRRPSPPPYIREIASAASDESL